MSDKEKRKINKASKSFEIQKISFEQYYGLMSAQFSPKNLSSLFPRQILNEIYSVGYENNAVQLIGAFDNHSLVAAIFLLTDAKSVYYLSGVNDRNAKYSMNLLLYRAICESINQKKSFDFEGSMIPSIEQFFRGFGGTKKTYYSARYSSGVHIDLIEKLKSWM